MRLSLRKAYFYLLFALVVGAGFLLSPGRLDAQSGDEGAGAAETEGVGGLRAEAEVSYTFGQVMRFHLQAWSSAEIQEAALFFNTPEMETTYSVEVPLQPAREIALIHEVALAQVQLAPFSEVTYWWRLVSGGEATTVGPQSIAYVDDRFEWQQLEQEGVVVHWTGGDVSLGQAALDAVNGARPQLETLIPTAAVTPLRIFIYPSTGDLRSALRLTGRDWVGAEARPELGVLLVTAVNPRTASYDLSQSVPHELAHLLLYRATGAGYENIPRWFEEGVATLVEATPDPAYESLLEEAVAARSTIPFPRLCDAFPHEEAEARLAYAQSASLVRFIQAEYGNQALAEMVRAFADGAGCHSGVRRVLGLSIDELEADWLNQVSPLSPAAAFWRGNIIWFLLLGGGFGIMALLLLPLRGSARRQQ